MDVYAFLSNYKNPKLAKAPSSSPGDSSVKRFRNCLPMPRNKESEEDSEPSQSEESQKDSSDSEESSSPEEEEVTSQ